jgi:hypothetical protein
MIGFIGTWVTISRNYNQYSTIADLHTFQLAVAHAQRFSVSTSHLLAMNLNTGAITSNHYEVFFLNVLCVELSFLTFEVVVEVHVHSTDASFDSYNTMSKTGKFRSSRNADHWYNFQLT